VVAGKVLSRRLEKEKLTVGNGLEKAKLKRKCAGGVKSELKDQ